MGQSDFPELGQYLCSQELVWQAISYSTAAKFSALLLDWATNARIVGASTDDVSTLGGVVRTMGAAADAFSPKMVRTY
jgi:hypothetical protein